MRNCAATIVFLLIAACGGGGYGGEPTISQPPPPVSDADPGGLWSGSLVYEDMTSEELVGISTSDGRFTFISIDTFGPDTVAQYVGTSTTDGSNVSGSGRAFAPPGSTWSNGSGSVDFTVTAEIVERTTMSGTWQNSIGESGSFDLAYDTEYERDSSLTLLEGVWFVYDEMRNANITFTVDADGSFSGQSNMGCQSLGQVAIIDADFNVFDWTVTISGCAIAGDYTGFAVVGDVDTGQNNFVLVSISNDLRAFLLPLER